MKAKRIVFTGKQALDYEEYNVPEPAAGEVVVVSLVSLMSTGTENIVFNRAFDPGTNWDHWVKYPFYPGYAMVGVVETVGEGVTGLKKGMRVAHRRGHASAHCLPENECFPLPEGLDPEQAVWFALAKISSMGARAARFHMGDSVLVIGAGPIGQMAIRWAHAMGCEFIVAADRVPMRLNIAKLGGAQAVISTPIEESLDQLKAACGGQLPRVVIDSTGNAQVFSNALKVARDKGRVVILGDTGTPAGQHLTQDVISRGLNIVGAHDVHEEGEWNTRNIIRFFFGLVAGGRFNVAALNTHRFKPSDLKEAYRVANELRGETMGILFDWTKGA